MKKGKSKNKGNKYEIKIARIFSDWYHKNFKDAKCLPRKRHDYFWRTAGSGAKATVTRSAPTSFVGDITFLPDPDHLQIWIDTKSVKKASFNSILSDEKFLIHDWYREEVKKKKRLKVKKPVVIIFKLYGKKEDYVFFRTSSFIFSCGTHYTGTIEWGKFAIIRLETFLERVNKEEILK